MKLSDKTKILLGELTVTERCLRAGKSIEELRISSQKACSAHILEQVDTAIYEGIALLCAVVRKRLVNSPTGALGIWMW